MTHYVDLFGERFARRDLGVRVLQVADQVAGRQVRERVAVVTHPPLALGRVLLPYLLKIAVNHAAHASGWSGGVTFPILTTEYY
jgi:hypothetical protein